MIAQMVKSATTVSSVYLAVTIASHVRLDLLVLTGIARRCAHPITTVPMARYVSADIVLMAVELMTAVLRGMNVRMASASLFSRSVRGILSAAFMNSASVGSASQFQVYVTTKEGVLQVPSA